MARFSLSRWFRGGLGRTRTPIRKPDSRNPKRFRLGIETLEDRALPSLSGAIFTTTVDGSAVNANIYGDKCEVYLNGGPDHSGHLDAGTYYFDVQTPDGATDLSNFAIDTIAQRTVHIGTVVGPDNIARDGLIDQYMGTLHATGVDAVTGAITVGLAPFADTTVDHEYKVALILIAVDNPLTENGVPGDQKTDNFKTNPETFNPVTNFGTISGRKFEDMNANGVDDNDPGVQGWQITLTGTGAGPDGVMGTGDDVTVNTSTTTGPGGSYSFGGLYAGNYTVTEASNSDWTHTTPNPVNVTLTSTTTFSCPDIITTVSSGTASFGNFHNASISGHKFEDHNGNGVQDPGDQGLAGWHILLNGVDSATTDSNGDYTISNVAPGTYTIQEVLQPGWTQTFGNTGYTVTVGGSGVQSGGTSTGNDFGNFQNISLSGTKFEDLTGNGFSFDDPVLNSANPHYVSVTVNLFKNGLPAGTTATDANGNYSFGDLGPGTYTVSEVVPSGWTMTAQTGATVVATSGTNSTGNNFDDFLNSTLANSGGFTLGFWHNHNGQALLTQADFNLLNSLNLKNADGSDADFTGSLASEKAQLSSWLVSGTATNMANMLSVQFATLELNTSHGFINSSAVVNVNILGGSSLVADLNSGPDGVIASGGLITVAQLESKMNSVLGSPGGNIVLGGNSLRPYEAALETIADGLNNNLAIIQV
jgi:hypothetical protein